MLGSEFARRMLSELSVGGPSLREAMEERLRRRVAKSSTEYPGVFLDLRCATEAYEARSRRGGRRVSLGRFATLEEAALCVALSAQEHSPECSRSSSASSCGTAHPSRRKGEQAEEAAAAWYQDAVGVWHEARSEAEAGGGWYQDAWGVWHEEALRLRHDDPEEEEEEEEREEKGGAVRVRARPWRGRQRGRGHHCHRRPPPFGPVRVQPALPTPVRRRALPTFSTSSTISTILPSHHPTLL